MSFLKDLSKALKRAPSLASTTAALADVESRERGRYRTAQGPLAGQNRCVIV